jgi:hypothetical protein
MSKVNSGQWWFISSLRCLDAAAAAAADVILIHQKGILADSLEVLVCRCIHILQWKRCASICKHSSSSHAQLLITSTVVCPSMCADWDTKTVATTSQQQTSAWQF